MIWVVVAVLVVGAVVVAVLARRGAAGVESRVGARLAALDVRRQEKAALDGGRGVLALTPTELVFLRFVPDEEVRLPRAGLRAAAVDGRLVVTSGEEEHAFVVDDPASWTGDLVAG